MRIGIFGTGGVGGYFGGLLANAGHDVTFIARGEHLRAIQSRGLQIKSVNGDFTIHPAKATDDSYSVGVLDYVVIGVKYYQLEAAIPGIRPLIGPQTTVVPLLNGVDAHEPLMTAFGAKSVVGGLSSVVSMIEAPGIIRQETKLRRVVIGELDGKKTDRVENLVEAWRDCGAEAIHAEDIFVALYTKFLFISAFGGVSSVSRATMGELMACPETKTLLIQAMREVEALARTKDIHLESDVVESTVAFMEKLEPSVTSSMQRDVEAGRPFELKAFQGTIVRLGREFSVPTPVSETIYALLRPALHRAFRDRTAQ